MPSANNVQSLGPPAILAPPAGWLGLLGIKNGGRQPVANSPVLASTMEMFNFYLAGQRSIVLANFLAAALNGVTHIGKVPAGKAWIVDGIVAISSPAGATAAWQGYIQVNSAANGGPLYLSPPSPIAAPAQTVLTSLKGPLVLVSGDEVLVFTSAPAAFTGFSWSVTVLGLEVSA